MYLRYGELPGCGSSHDFTYQEHHDGVAVWRAILTPQGRCILCADRLAHQAQLTILATLQQRLLYEASGEEVATVQGEVPILRNCTLKRRSRTQVVPLRWSRELMYEVLRQYPPLQKRLLESGQARSEPRYEERPWRKVWAVEGKPAPEHEAGSYCPLSPPAPHQRWEKKRVVDVASDRLRNVSEMGDLSEFHEAASKRWEELGLPPAPPPQEDWEPCYVRFGDDPHCGRSFNWQLGEYEPGVAVFSAYRTREGAYLLDCLDSPLLAITYVRLSTAGYRAYRVYGTPCGTGGGG